MDTAVIFQIQSFLIMALIYFGVYVRKNRSLHVKIMGSAITWDIILILQIELSRSAIMKASKAMTNAMWLNIHVSIAVATVLLYFALIYTGRKMLNNEHSIRPKHKILGFSALVFRTLTFATSFLAV
ncbi:MAG: hypothetical protein GY909_00800 [Oligoflexia bacterium]|nr:hypothetical protein [Oligoflexia bacterium]